MKKELRQRTRAAGQSRTVGNKGWVRRWGILSSGAGQVRAVGCSLGGGAGRRGAEY